MSKTQTSNNFLSFVVGTIFGFIAFGTLERDPNLYYYFLAPLILVWYICNNFVFPYIIKRLEEKQK